LSYIQVLQLISFAFLMSGGQVLFKKTALSISAGLNNENSLGLIEGILKAATIPWLYMALFTYGIATLFWLYILQRIPLTLAYPFSALAMIIVPILAIFLFGEKLNWSYWIGIIFIFIGITIIAR
jgi:drug/metabolite transporter (DMT)-like permease